MVVEGGGRLDVKFWTFAGGRVTKMEQVRTSGEGGSKFWPFCENIIIKGPRAQN